MIVSVLFETWSDKKSPSYFARTTPLKPGLIDRGGIQWGEYGGKEGIWRLIRVLDRSQMRASFFCSGRSAELYPDVFKQLTKSGHLVEGHGYVQDQAFLELPPEQQKALIRKTLDLLSARRARAPEGWATPIYGWDEHTFALLVEAGIKWYADALDISLPRKENTAAGPIVALPWSDFVDNRVLRASPRDYLDVYIDTFDYLHNHEPGGLINVAIHAHFGGRPLIVGAIPEAAPLFLQLQRRVVPHTSRTGEVVSPAEASTTCSYRQPFLSEQIVKHAITSLWILASLITAPHCARC